MGTCPRSRSRRLRSPRPHLKDAGANGDARLRQSYQNVLAATLPHIPKDIVDLGCSVGMSTFAMQKTYPNASITGVDLSPYFLAVANYRMQKRGQGTGTGYREHVDKPSTHPSSLSLNPLFPTPHHPPLAPCCCRGNRASRCIR